MVEFITERNDWNELINLFHDAEVYHTFDYHNLVKKECDKPILIKYVGDNSLVAMPIIIRPIEGTNLNDAISVYGYSGPLGIGVNEKFDYIDFNRKLTEYLRSQNIVSVFVRLNPLISYQSFILRGSGTISSLGKVVNIDLSKSKESQKKHYSSRLLTYLNRLRERFAIECHKDEQSMSKFIEIYYETMLRVGADTSYFFKKSYFNGLLKSKEFDTDLLLAYDKKNGEILGGGIFIKKNKTVQYHLGATRNNRLNLSPSKLIIDEMRIRGSNEGFSNFNLGGGVKGKKDSLFYFKSNFSKDILPFKAWKMILETSTYDNLVKIKLGENSTLNSINDFFPLYRSQILEKVDVTS